MVLAVAVAVVVPVAAGACSTPPPQASNAVPPPATAAPEAPIVWAALGGDETVTTGPPEEAATAWPQRVLSRLPATAELVNVATPDASIRTGLTSQVPALEANGVRPTVATVWFGRDERGSTSQQRADLTALVERLRALGTTRIVLVAGPGPSATALAQDVAAATGAVALPVAGIGRDAMGPAAQAGIAEAVAPVLAP